MPGIEPSIIKTGPWFVLPVEQVWMSNLSNSGIGYHILFKRYKTGCFYYTNNVQTNTIFVFVQFWQVILLIQSVKLRRKLKKIRSGGDRYRSKLVVSNHFRALKQKELPPPYFAGLNVYSMCGMLMCVESEPRSRRGTSVFF